ncbi:hypothetical protein KKA00_08770 [bacterium]|nr:hypothetical protein [bacterium]
MRLFGIISRTHNDRYFTRCPVEGLPHVTKANLCEPDYHTNSRHLRDREIPLNKPDNSFRLAIVGNSVTIGHEVAQHELFTEILEDSLNARYQQRPSIEVINAGQANYDINHFLPFTEYFVYPYDPDLIVYQFCWNDIAARALLRKARFPEDVGEKSFQRLLLMHSAIYLKLYRLSNTRAFGQKLVNYYKDAALMSEFYRYLWDWERDVQSRQIRFAMMIVPLGIEVEATDRYPDLARQFIHQRGLIIAECERNGIPVINLSEPLRDHYFAHHKTLYLDQGHLNPLGHQVVANALFHSLPLSINSNP